MVYEFLSEHLSAVVFQCFGDSNKIHWLNASLAATSWQTGRFNTGLYSILSKYLNIPSALCDWLLEEKRICYDEQSRFVTYSDFTALNIKTSKGFQYYLLIMHHRCYILLLRIEKRLLCY